MHKIGWKSAMSLVISNIIGTGIYTTLGFQLLEVKSTYAIILLWILGGFLSLCGAFSYAQLSTHFKRSGGDYIYLSKMYHPILGYFAGGFLLVFSYAAPVAMSAIAISQYLKPFGVVNGKWLEVLIVLAISLAHSLSVKGSAVFQNISVSIKYALPVGLILLGILIPSEENSFNFPVLWEKELLSSGYAVALIYVTYAYSGWNAASHIIEEVDKPKINIPRALILGTLIVTIVYVLLNFIFLKHAPAGSLEGQTNVATIVSSYMLGNDASRWVSALITLQLISTISANVWVGSRVSNAMAQDQKLLRGLSYKNPQGVPIYSVWVQAFISLLFIFFGSFQKILICTSLVLQLIKTLTIIGLLFFKTDKHESIDTYKSPLFPWLQVIYVLFSFWILGYISYEFFLNIFK